MPGGHRGRGQGQPWGQEVTGGTARAMPGGDKGHGQGHRGAWPGGHSWVPPGEPRGPQDAGGGTVGTLGTSHPGQVHLVLPAQLIQGQFVVILPGTQHPGSPQLGGSGGWHCQPCPVCPLLTRLTSFFSSSNSFSFCFLLPPPFSEVVPAGEYSRPACGHGRHPWARLAPVGTAGTGGHAGTTPPSPSACWHPWACWYHWAPGRGHYHGHGCHCQHGGHRGHRHHRGSAWARGGLRAPGAAWA